LCRTTLSDVVRHNFHFFLLHPKQNSGNSIRIPLVKFEIYGNFYTPHSQDSYGISTPDLQTPSSAPPSTKLPARSPKPEVPPKPELPPEARVTKVFPQLVSPKLLAAVLSKLVRPCPSVIRFAVSRLKCQNAGNREKANFAPRVNFVPWG
jgi:hypothetical protein